MPQGTAIPLMITCASIQTTIVPTSQAKLENNGPTYQFAKELMCSYHFSQGILVCLGYGEPAITSLLNLMGVQFSSPSCRELRANLAISPGVSKRHNPRAHATIILTISSLATRNSFLGDEIYQQCTRGIIITSVYRITHRDIQYWICQSDKQAKLRARSVVRIGRKSKI